MVQESRPPPRVTTNGGERMRFVKCTDGGEGYPILVPLDNILIVFKEGDADIPSSFYAWTIGKDNQLVQRKYTAVGQNLADSLVEI